MIDMAPAWDERRCYGSGIGKRPAGVCLRLSNVQRSSSRPIQVLGTPLVPDDESIQILRYSIMSTSLFYFSLISEGVHAAFVNRRTDSLMS